jgi:hypothetical protein
MTIVPPSTVTLQSGPGAAETFNLRSLPARLHNRYRYAAQFVDLVRSKTAKITLHTPRCRFSVCMCVYVYVCVCVPGSLFCSCVLLIKFSGTHAHAHAHTLANDSHGQLMEPGGPHADFDAKFYDGARLACHGGSVFFTLPASAQPMAVSRPAFEKGELPSGAAGSGVLFEHAREALQQTLSLEQRNIGGMSACARR